MRVRIVEIGMLGPIEARDGDGTRLVVPGGRPLTLLALLLTRRGSVVSPRFAADALWPGRPPKDPANALQLSVSRLRKALGGVDSRPASPGYGVIASVPGGYVLRLPVGWTDADQFESLAAAGRAQLARGEPAEAAATLRRALGLWRGPALAEVRDEPFARPVIERLDRLRMAVLSDRIDADLALGRHSVLAGELEALAGEHPLDDRLRAQLLAAGAHPGVRPAS
ncbi:MAG TPA: BTAD domain-containing putative transcriptional regulator [Streptosporangiaceae bacterium]|nr:BTAD domain-containing putative transcriptional regulator [Streptosporangiaceae bacterium]